MRKRGSLSNELLQAIALIGIIAALLFPALSRAAAGEDSGKTNESVLHSRVFKVDTNRFVAGLGMTGAITNGLHSTNTSDIERAVVRFFEQVGVHLGAPKSVFFKDRDGALVVRATDEDLELIEQAVNVLNVTPPEVQVKVRLLEVHDEDMFKPGFDWLLKTAAKNGTNNWGLNAILTEPQSQALLKNFGTNGIRFLAESQITTLSGRQATFGLGGSNTNQSSSTQINYTDRSPVEFDTNDLVTLDVVPYVSADGHTIQLTLIPTQLEPLRPGESEPVYKEASSIPERDRVPPHTRVHQMVTSCIVWDGQTAVLLLKPHRPHQGNLAIFVTPTIVDPAGNRVHQEDERSKDYYDEPPHRGGGS